ARHVQSTLWRVPRQGDPGATPLTPESVKPAGGRRDEVQRSGPLAGVKILHLTSVVMGAFATQILAALGADVIKVESPEGDNMRHVGPMNHPGMGHIYLHANRGKRSIVLDLKQPQARKAALQLAERCDVLISNVRPQALARLGLDYNALRERNPRLIHV